MPGARVVRIPFRQSAERSAPAELDALLVEGSPPDAERFCAAAGSLTRMHLTTTWVRSVSAARERLATGTFDVVFLDLQVEDASGVPAIERVLPLIGDIPLIVLSGHLADGAPPPGLRHGAHDYLSKEGLTPELLERTTRHAFERAAWRREQRDQQVLVREVLASTPDLLVVLDSAGRIELVNDAWRDASRDHGGAQDGYLGASYLGVCRAAASMGSPGADEMAEVLTAVLDGRREAGVVEYECVRLERIERYRAHIRRVRSSRGGVLISHHDVTEAWQRANALERSEQSFRALIDRSPDAIAVLSGGKILYGNAQLAQVFGGEHASQLQGEELTALVVHDERERFIAWAQGVLSQGTQRSIELRFHSPEGTRILEVEGLPVTFAGHEAIVVHARDVTDRRELARQAMHLDRAITTGLLAAGVGHEINNPLSYVVTNLELLAELLAQRGGQEQGPQLERVLGLIEEARDGTGRVQRIVADLRRLASVDESEHELVSIEEPLRAALRSVRKQQLHHCQVIEEIDADAAPIVGDETKLIQVFSNLLVNAGYAVRSQPAGQAIVRVRLQTRGSRVVVEVEDNGVGIAPEHLDHVFEPFFSTKGKDGTGLGLSICRDVVLSHGGAMTVRSGSGTTCFRVTFPGAVETSTAVRVDDSLDPRDEVRRRILVIDDDLLVGRAARRALEAHYEVVVASSGEEGLAQLDAQHFDLVLCDVMMPGMDGYDVHREATQRFPELKQRFVFVTGGTTTRSDEFTLESSDVPTIHKPFGLGSLREYVSRRLATGGDAAASG